MPSRKRNKGKERRAKKEAVENQTCLWRRIAQPAPAASCNHGCPSLPPRDHPVSRFMATLAERNGRKIALVTVMEKLFKCHPEVWKNDEYRQMAIDILLSVGTNTILGAKGDEDNCVQIAWEVGFARLLLDCYDGNGDFSYAYSCVQVRMPVFMNDCGTRDILKFYSKRLPCTCLNVRYKIARKTMPKRGACKQCDKLVERALLLTCGHCKVPFYCSRECQVAHVPEHKNDCGMYVDIRRHKVTEKKISK